MRREHLGARAVEPKEDGFTLLELMMVILIIGILIAVLTPVLLGATSRAKDRAMQTSLTTAVTGAKTFFLAKADYTAATPAAMTAETGGLTYIGANVSPTGQNTVSVNGVSTNVVIFAGLSKSGSCFYVMDDQSSGVTSYAKLAGAGGCAATTITPIDLAWKTSW